MASHCFPEAFAAWRALPGYSFSAAAGPLPVRVAREVAAACRPGPGSVLSLPFTSAVYRTLQAETEACLRRLLAIPDDFAVLFMAGGASAQFALLPMNLLGKGDETLTARALYIDSGHWSRRAIAEARRYGEVAVVGIDARRGPRGEVEAGDQPGRARLVPAGDGSPRLRIEVPAGRYAYAHFTSNETADGQRFAALPEVALPLAADMTSDLLTRPLDWARVGVVYAGLQKTAGTPGLVLVIVRRTLLGCALGCTPRVFDYAALAAADSRLCTPPVLPVFVAHRMLHWIEDEGGVPAMAARLARRHALLQAALDDGNAHGGEYRQPVARPWRSAVNPCFHLADAAGTEAFVTAAEAAGLRDLRGHPEVGGVRVSLYHGVSDAAVEALADFIVAHARRQAATRARSLARAGA